MEKEDPSYLAGGPQYKIVQPLWRTVWKFLKKISESYVIWLSNSTPMYVLKKTENTHLHKNFHTHVHSIIIYNSQTVETTQTFINWWIKWYIYTYNGILFINKRNEALIHATTWMNLEKNVLSEKGMTEDEMVGWHHRLDGHEFE